MKSGSRSLWWMVATVLAVCLLYLGYRQLKRQAVRDNENPYEYDIEDYKESGGSAADYIEVDAIALDQNSISALAVAPDGRILLAADDGIHIYGQNGKRTSSIGVGRPVGCIAVAEDGVVYAGVQDHIEVYGADGTLIAAWTSLGENSRITSIAIVDGNLYAADCGNKLVWRYQPDGTLLGNIEGVDPDGQGSGFVVPSPYFDLAPGTDGTLWIVNPGKTAVQLYSPSGDLLRSWGESAMGTEGFCGCCNPSHIAVTPEGNIVTAEKGLARVKVYDPDGGMQALVAAPVDLRGIVRGGEGRALIQDLAVNGSGQILVLDCKAKRIRVYERRK